MRQPRGAGDCPVTAVPPSGCFAMVDTAHVAEVGPAAALLFARIVWRCERTGSWRATRRELASETGLTEAMLRTAVQVLRDREWVTTERTSAEDATLVWRPLCARPHQHIDDSAPPPAESAPPPVVNPPDPPADSAMSSTETVETSTTTHAGGVEDAPPAALFAVPDPQPEAVTEPEQTGPPKTAQTLVARWCDGYRAANGGEDAPKAFMARVAGQAKQLAKASGDDHDEWVRAWGASYAAGQAGQADMTRFLVRTPQRSTGRGNHFARAGLQGTGAGMLAALANPHDPPAIGTR